MYCRSTNGEQRLALLTALVGQVRRQDFPYEPKPEKKLDWSSYTMAQVHEVDDALRAIRRTVDIAARRLPKRPNVPGRPPVPVTDLAKAVLAQQYFGTANRQTEGLILLFREKLGITSDFSYKTIERAYERPEVRALLQKIFQLTLEAAREIETGLGVDGTGLPKSTKRNYESNKKPDEHVEMAQFTVGLDTLLLFKTTLLKGRSEHATFAEALKGAGSVPALAKVVGDAQYTGRPNCNVVDELGAEPYFFPKRGLSFKRLGSDAWVAMLHGFVNDTQAWLRAYHARSLTETVNSTIKRDFPVPLRRKIPQRRRVEVEARSVVYNLKRGCYLRYMMGLRPAWEDWAA